MKRSILRFLTLMIAMAVVFSSCNLPSNEPGIDEQPPDVQTSVAQTVAAADGTGDQDADGSPTATSGDPAEGTQAPESTETAAPTETDAPTATQEPTETPLPCNAAEFVKDVTVPDGKKFDPGAAFTKTWRLKNVGTCAWTSGYDLVFAGGDAMDGPSAKQLTTDPVEPGETLDVSVDLTAPASAGVYRGNWELRDPEADTFGIENSSSGVFWVEIEVVEPTETPLVIITVNPGVTLVLNPTANLNHSSRGSVWDGFQVLKTVNNVGDDFRNSSNLGVQGFITYDLSSIPDGANILSARLVPIGTPDTIGNPFSDLGYLRVYVDNYGELKMNDYTPPPVTGAIIRFSSFNKMVNDTNEQSFSSAGLAALESALGGDQFQIRLQFNNKETDNDGNTDMVRATFKLVITYQNP